MSGIRGGVRLPALFWICLVVALAVRLPGIDKGLRSDEMGHLQSSSLPLAQIVPAILADDAHPPLSYFVYHVWLMAGDGDVWARLLSVALGIAICVLVFSIGRGRVSETTRLTAMWLVAIAPASVLMSQTVRSYTLAAVFVLGALLAVAAIDEERERAGWRLFVAYTVCAVLALFTFYVSVLALATYGTYGCWQWRRSAKVLRRWVMANAAVAALYVPWLPYMARQLARASGDVPDVGGFYVGGLYLGGTIRGLSGLFGLDDAFLLDQSLSTSWPRALLVAAGLAAAAGAYVLIAAGVRGLKLEAAQAGRRGFMPLIVVAGLVPAALAIGAHHLTGLVMTPRYMYPSFLILAYLIAAAIVRLGPRGVRLAALTACSMLLLTRDAQLYAWTEVDWKRGAAYVTAAYEPGDLVLFVRDERARRYFPASVPTIDLARAGAPAVDLTLADSGLRARLGGQRRLWVVLNGTTYRKTVNADVAAWVLTQGFRHVAEQPFGVLRVALYERDQS